MLVAADRVYKVALSIINYYRVSKIVERIYIAILRNFRLRDVLFSNKIINKEKIVFYLKTKE